MRVTHLSKEEFVIAALYESLEFNHSGLSKKILFLTMSMIATELEELESDDWCTAGSFVLDARGVSIESGMNAAGFCVDGL